MTTFPALVPSSRTFTPGEYPATAFAGYNGAQSRVRHSDVFLSAQLRLSFLGISESQMLTIWNHYTTKRGGYEEFQLPAAITQGTDLVDYVPAGYSWRYADEGSVEDLPCGGHNVSLTLETVPAALVNASGATLELSLSLSAGAAIALSSTPGATLGLSMSLAAGVAFTSVNAPGANLAVALSLETGVATGAASVDGAELSLSLSLTTGSADGGASQSDYWSDWVAQNYGWESLIFIDWWGS